MTVSSVVIEPLKDLKDWYRMSFKSQKNGIGETSIEMLVSGDTLKMLRNQIGKAFGEKPDYSDYSENIKRFMEGE